MVAIPASTLAIVGSRTLTDYEFVKDELNYFFTSWYVSDIITGGAVGADSWGELYARQSNIPVTIIRPDYTKYGKGAPFIRNTTIAEKCNLMVAFWDGQSRGTEDVIKKAVKLGKRVTIIPFVPKESSLDEGPEI